MSIATEARVECPRPEKKVYTTESEARERLEAARKDLSPDLDVYRCVCGSWHLGKSRARFEKRMKRVLSGGRHRQRLDQSRTTARRKR